MAEERRVSETKERIRNETGIRGEAEETRKQHHGEGEIGTEARETQSLPNEIARRQVKSGNRNVSPWKLSVGFRTFSALGILYPKLST